MADNIENGVHGCTATNKYVQPTDPLVLKKLEEFKDKKLGFMMHWSPATQLGLVESWAMVDEEWSQSEIDWVDGDMNEFRRQYKDLYKTFNPIRFQPKKWAKLAKDCGFKYVLFTTKHHDGFCMWDTKTKDYKITSKNCPFSKHKYSDIVKNIFESFRQEGLGIHAYFSKPDWDCEYYWSPKFEWPNGKTDRNVNYNISEHPDIWEKFVKYTHTQITELMTNYGDIDVLWLDGGQVNPNNRGQDIKLGELVEKIRSTTQPGLISADRTVGGPYENFITPEQSLPKEPITVPWESCITLGTSFSFKYEDVYKSPRTVIHMLIDIVAKGGNLALNITPQPDGRLPKRGIEVLQELGKFMKINGDGIYSTRICAPYTKSKYAFTKKDNKIYVFYLYEENEIIKNTFNIPISIDIESIKLMGSKIKLNYKNNSNEIVVKIDDRIPEKTPYADGFCIKLKN